MPNIESQVQRISKIVNIAANRASYRARRSTVRASVLHKRASAPSINLRDEPHTSRMDLKPEPSPEEVLLKRKTLADLFREKLQRLNRTLLFQRVFIIAKHFSTEEMEAKGIDAPKKVFYKTISKMMQKIQADTFTHDQITGILLYMGEYSLLVIEANEDMVGYCIRELNGCAPKFWKANRIISAEEIFEETYFNLFYMRNASVVHVNETIPDNAANDIEYLAGQHIHLTAKLQALCGKLGKRLGAVMLPDVAHKKEKAQLVIQMHLKKEEPLNAERYNKFLPEVQHMDIILGAEGYYFDVKLFSTLYDGVPVPTDYDALIYPVPYNYFPPGLFSHTQFDVNITYAEDYADEIRLYSDKLAAMEALYPDDDSVTEPISEEAEEEAGSEEMEGEQVEEEAVPEKAASDSLEEVMVEEESSEMSEEIGFLLDAMKSKISAITEHWHEGEGEVGPAEIKK